MIGTDGSPKVPRQDYLEGGLRHPSQASTTSAEGQKTLVYQRCPSEGPPPYDWPILGASGRFEGKKLLEVGSGATVHNIASASAYFPIIVQSDFVEDNLENLKLWHKGQSPLDWSAFLDIVASLEDFK
ncbi:hypothetical protein AVEN_82247-1, partial [Araneus ventricosus]